MVTNNLQYNDVFMFISCNIETDCFLFPVLPEKISYSDSIKNTSVNIVSLGETTVIECKGADTISFSSRFPAVRDQAVVVDQLFTPSYYRDKLEKWRDLQKPVHFVCTSALDINDYYTIEDLSYSEEGGPVGEIAFTIKLKLYRPPTIRKIDLSPKDNTVAEVTTDTGRVDNTIKPSTYTVVSGDTLAKIAKAKLGSISKYKDIYELNKDIIKDPNKIYPGQVLKMPTDK